MLTVDDVYPPWEQDKINDKIKENDRKLQRRLEDAEVLNPGRDKPKLQCERWRPRGGEFVGAGRNRCVFRVDDSVVKVARDVVGRDENEAARTVMEHVSEENMQFFAEPYDVSEDATFVTQEAVRRAGDQKVPPPGSEGLFEELRWENLSDVRGEDGVDCTDDVAWNDTGFKDGRLVLADLGACRLEN